jgi:hypothetical protein
MTDKRFCRFFGGSIQRLQNFATPDCTITAFTNLKDKLF